MTRNEAANWLADIAEPLGGDGRVSIRLADSTVRMDVPDQVRCEAEVEVDGDEVEFMFEFELTWSTCGTGSATAHPNGAAHS